MVEHYLSLYRNPTKTERDLQSQQADLRNRSRYLNGEIEKYAAVLRTGSLNLATKQVFRGKLRQAITEDRNAKQELAQTIRDCAAHQRTVDRNGVTKWHTCIMSEWGILHGWDQEDNLHRRRGQVN